MIRVRWSLGRWDGMPRRILRSLLILTTLAPPALAGCRVKIIPVYLDPDAADTGLEDAPWSDGDATALPLTCDEPLPTFALCGGNPIGEWVSVVLCPASNLYDPLQGTCDAIQIDGTGSGGAVLAIRPDGSWRLEMETVTTVVDFSFPLSCYGGGSAPCNGAIYNGQCARDGGDTCACRVDRTRPPTIEEGRWTTVGAYLDVLGPPTTLQHLFCVDEDADVLDIQRLGIGTEVPWRAVFVRR